MSGRETMKISHPETQEYNIHLRLNLCKNNRECYPHSHSPQSPNPSNVIAIIKQQIKALLGEARPWRETFLRYTIKGIHKVEDGSAI